MDLATAIELTNALFAWYATQNAICYREAGQAIAALIDNDVDRLRKIIDDFKASR
jgi:hypothetical protein